MSEHAVLRLLSGAACITFIVGGCASFTQEQARLDVTPVQTPAAPLSRTDGYYYSAVAAIERQDYVRALEALQAARQLSPSDVRVINAFGVVYDKLGRFDLSTRYYAQAKAIDASSPVVQANIAYSAVLSGAAKDQTAAPAPATALAAAPPPAAAPTPVALAGGPPAKPASMTISRMATDVASVASAQQPQAAPLRIAAPPARTPIAPPPSRTEPIRAASVDAAAKVGLVAATARTVPVAASKPVPASITAAPPRSVAALTPTKAPPPSRAEPVHAAPVGAIAKVEVAAATSKTMPVATSKPAPASITAAPPRSTAALTPTKAPPPSRAEPVHAAPVGAIAKVEVAAVTAKTIPVAASKPTSASITAAPIKAAATTTSASATKADPRPLPRAVTSTAQAVSPRAAPRPSVRPVTVAKAPPQPAPAKPVARAAAPFAVVTAPAPKLAVAPARVAVVRPPLYIVNASGQSARGEPIRLALASKGWSTPTWALQKGPVQARSIIHYPPNRKTVAMALAMTLPARPQLAPCQCAGLKLVLGTDAKGWRPMPVAKQTRARI